MSNFCTFTVGETYSNKDIVDMFKCGNMGGMRRSHTTNSLVLISDHTKGLYDDKWVNDVLHYTGMGKVGDQTLSSQNRTLAESNDSDIEVHLFEVLKATEYIYRGQVSLMGKPYQEEQLDSKGLLRTVWMFPIAMQSADQGISQELVKNLQRDKERKASRASDEEVFQKALINESRIVSQRKISSTVYLRDSYVSEYAKRRANGKCQLCGEDAPFQNQDGKPYLETHHIVWVSQGGSDTMDNTVALCPNCHRKMHVLNLKEDKEYLKAVIEREKSD